MDGINISSLNCQGLGNFQKRRDVFHYLRKKQYNIYFLQDTHFEEKSERQIRAEWGYECVFASKNTRSRGVAILFNNNFDFKIKETIKDNQGNFIILKLHTLGKDIVLVNIYGPNRDNPPFFKDIKKRIEELNTPYVIIGGDWNLVLNPSLDYHNYRTVNNEKAQETVIEMMSEMELVDIWREINPDVLRYTWRRQNPFQQSRLDFFLVTDTLITNVKETDIQYGYRSDHSLIHVKLIFKQEERHKNFWKFNSSLLKDPNYVHTINETIENIKEQYSPTPYSREQLSKIPNEQLQLTISDQLFLDVLLMEIRAKTISYSIQKKKTENEKEQQLENEIQSLEKNMSLDEENSRLLYEKKEKLTAIRKTKIEGTLLRAKARWAAEGEKISKYFCSLEKRHFISKQMLKLVTNKGETLSRTDDMLEETKKFYENLYSEKEIEDSNINDYITTLPKLTKSESDELEGLITMEEASVALKNMKNDKSPGTDGMTVNFLKFFWRQLGSFVVRSLNEGFLNGEMSVTQKEGIIICIPKSDKPREYLKNWRPISLLNVTYKIGSTCIANRIKKVLPKLISEDQTGFVSGRYIGDNLRTVYDMIHYLEEKQLPGLLVSIDFEKAFDSVNWTYMNNTMKAFGFGTDVCKWVTSFYNNIKSYVVVNGKVSQGFMVGRGCRQGDPISPYLFVLCAEILACKIREDKNIRGIKISETEFKISQFADDTSFTLEGDKQSYEKLFEILNTFEKMSGLKLNYEKTCNVWLGKKKNSSTIYLPHKKMEWNPPKFKILGLWFTNDISKLTEINIADKFIEVRNMFNTWAKRMNTPLGRVAILKSLILSKLVYLWILLPNPPDKQIKELQDMCYEFVWDKKRDRIKRKYAVHSIENGGIGIPDIKILLQSLKLSWIKKAYTGSPKWKVILQSLCPEVSLMDILGPERYNKSKLNRFWKDAFLAYNNFARKVDIETGQELLTEPIFFNGKFKIDKKSFYYSSWTRKNVYLVKDLVDENGAFLTYRAFSEKHGIKVNFLDYLSCIQSIKRYTTKISIEIKNNAYNLKTKALQVLSSVTKGSRIYYNLMMEKIEILNIKPFANWEYKLRTAIDWHKVLKKTKKIKEIKLKWFQLRICFRILVTNKILKEMGIAQNDECNFCKSEKDAIDHYLWDSAYIYNLSGLNWKKY